MFIFFKNKLISIDSNSFNPTLLNIKENETVLKFVTSNGDFIFPLEKKEYCIYNIFNILLITIFDSNSYILENLKSQLIKLLYYALNSDRQYFKLKGLGFFFKYLEWKKHYIVLSLGFSSFNYVMLPIMTCIKINPKRKKFIFSFKNSHFALLTKFIENFKKRKLPDPYKLKGIRNLCEYFDIKEGKKKK